MQAAQQQSATHMQQQGTKPTAGSSRDNNSVPRPGVGSARGGRQRQQQQEPIQKPPLRQHAIVRNVTLPEGIDSWYGIVRFFSSLLAPHLSPQNVFVRLPVRNTFVL